MVSGALASMESSNSVLGCLLDVRLGYSRDATTTFDRVASRMKRNDQFQLGVKP